jgi:outer membrane protein assembly factor BamB
VRRARGVLYASVGSVVLLALLLQGVPKPGSVDYPEVEDPLSYRASLPFFEAKGPIEVAPAFHDGRIYFAGRDGVLRALRRAEQVPNKKKEAGKFELAWKLEVGQFGDILSSPIVARDALFLSNVRGSVYSVSLEGEILWNKDIGRLEPIRPCALYGSAAELVGLAVVTREAVVVLSPDDGRQLYRLETGNRIIAEPVGDGELLFVGSGDNKVYCASWRSGEINWEFEDSDDIIALQRSSGLLVYATHGGRVVALDEVTGLERWRKAYARGSIRSAGRVGLDRVYVELDRGVVEVIDVRKGQALSTCKPNASLDVAMARPYGHRYFFASGAGHLGELDETGKMRWRSDIPLGGITGWVTGVDHIAVSNRQGNLVLFSLGPENVHRVSMNEDDG